MQKQLATSNPGAVSTPARISALEILRNAGNCHSTHLLFFHELTGGRGHGKVPSDEKERRQYYREVRSLIKKEYGYTDSDIARGVAMYKEPNIGPCNVRTMLLERRPDLPESMMPKELREELIET